MLSMTVSVCRTNIDVTRNQDVLHDLISYLCWQFEVPKVVSRSRHYRAATILFNLTSFGDSLVADERMVKTLED